MLVLQYQECLKSDIYHINTKELSLCKASADADPSAMFRFSVDLYQVCACEMV